MNRGRDDYQPCQWPKCSEHAAHQVHHDLESIHVCRAHRGAVVVNIETQGKIWVFKSDSDLSPTGARIRPGEEKPRYTGRPELRPGDNQPEAPDPQQVAAKRADAAATPMDPALDLVQPRKRTQGDAAASHILGDSVK